MKAWEFVSCHREDDSRDIVAEVRIPRHKYLSARDIERLVEAMLDEVGDDGELEYEWELSPGIIVQRHPQEHIPILEVALRATTTCGRYRPPVTGLDGDTVDALRRQHRGDMR